MVKNLIYKWELNSKMYQKGWKVKTECRNLAADNRKGVNVKVKRWTNKVAIGLRADAGHLASGPCVQRPKRQHPPPSTRDSPVERLEAATETTICSFVFWT